MSEGICKDCGCVLIGEIADGYCDECESDREDYYSDQDHRDYGEE